MERMLLVINPISGTTDKRGLAERITAILRQHGIDCRTAYTGHPGHATTLAAEAAAQGYDAVLACGGDGTVNETARALCGTKTALGIIPAGSGNGLARHIGIPIDPLASLRIIARRHVEACDYGTVNGQPFFCTFGIGFDAAVSDRFAAAPGRGRLTYIKSAMTELRHYTPQHYVIEADGHRIERDAFIITGANASQYGNNAYIAPTASIRDGFLDIVVVSPLSPPAMAMFGIDMMSGTLAHNRHIEVFRCRHALIERSCDGPAHIDGEPVTLGRTLEVQCHPAALNILTDAGKQPFTPVITPLSAFIEGITLSLHMG